MTDQTAPPPLRLLTGGAAWETAPGRAQGRTQPAASAATSASPTSTSGAAVIAPCVPPVSAPATELPDVAAGSADSYVADLALLTTSVVVCCYTERRWATLVTALGSLETQSRPADQVIVVVDHNDVLRERLATAHPGVEVVANRYTRGLSGARNTGIEAAHGDVVAFLDDDAVPARDWLERLVTSYRQTGADAIGGLAQPVWPAHGRPRWFAPELDWIVGCSYRGLPEERGPVRNLLGANMSFRRHALVAAGAFDERLGRVGTVPLGCEETHLCLRLRESEPGAQILHDPQVRVEHWVSADRVTWSYLRRRSYAEGLTKGMLTRVVPGAIDAERAYVAMVLRRAVMRELAGVCRGRLSGLAAIAAITWSVAAAAVGYLRARLARTSSMERTTQRMRSTG